MNKQQNGRVPNQSQLYFTPGYLFFTYTVLYEKYYIWFMETVERPSHIGRKIGRIRELRGMKQETLAEELGISQQAVSKIEQSETIEKDKLDQIAKVLGVTKEGIENFSDEAIFNIIGNLNRYKS